MELMTEVTHTPKDMKERYFTPENIQAKSLDIFTSVQDYRRSHDNLRFHPDRAALLVLDMQEYFLSEASHAFVPSAPAIIPNIQILIKVFAVYNRPIIITRHVNTEENAGMMGKWWKDLICPQAAYSHIIKQLDTSKGTILHKSQYDAFYETPLESDLRAGGVGEVVITGVMTHLCCETTARSALKSSLPWMAQPHITSLFIEQRCSTWRMDLPYRYRSKKFFLPSRMLKRAFDNSLVLDPDFTLPKDIGMM